MITTDNFYLSLSDESKKYFSDAINKMGWVEYKDGFWGLLTIIQNITKLIKI